MLKLIGRVAVAVAVCLSANVAAAQGWLNNLTNAGPQPADNVQVAMSQGRQIAGYGGKCAHVEGDMRPGALLVMRDCDANSVNQRFKFEGDYLKTSYRVSNGGNGWTVMCVTAVGQERLALQNCPGTGMGGIVGAINQGVGQQWAINGREIRRKDAADCFDVYKSWTDNNTPILHYRCNGGANQQWGWR